MMARKSGSEGIRERSPGSWEVRYEVARDTSGKRKTKTVTVRGTLRDAQRERRRLMATIDQGVICRPVQADSRAIFRRASGAMASQ
jgi:hypothetical protein